MVQLPPADTKTHNRFQERTIVIVVTTTRRRGRRQRTARAVSLRHLLQAFSEGGQHEAAPVSCSSSTFTEIGKRRLLIRKQQMTLER